jgi:hypothetical protein
VSSSVSVIVKETKESLSGWVGEFEPILRAGERNSLFVLIASTITT